MLLYSRCVLTIWPRGLGFLCAVLGTGLHALGYPLGVQSTADDVVTHTGQVLYTSAANQDNAVLLQIMAFTRYRKLPQSRWTGAHGRPYAKPS